MSLPADAERSASATTDRSRSARFWSARSWIPHSPAAIGVFLLLAVLMAIPVLIASFMAYIAMINCFLMACAGRHPGAAAVFAAAGLSFALVPFVGVSWYQGSPASTRSDRAHRRPPPPDEHTKFPRRPA
jgi:hypothetical protein